MARTIVTAFNELLDRLDLTPEQTSIASARSKRLKDFFDANFSMSERAFTIGSYRRGTLVRPERDIDILAPLSYAAYRATYDDDPRGLLYFVRDKLNRGYSTTKVPSREVAVFLDFSVIRADVVPAFPRKGGGYFIPNGNLGWLATNPPHHARLITERDTQLGGRLRPLIRLLKFWNMANGDHLSSFHVELMTWLMWKEVANLSVYPNAVMQSLAAMRGSLGSPLYDPWSPGRRVDAYLRSVDRDRVRRMLAQDAKAAQQAEEHRKAGEAAKAFERWAVIYRHQFPTYG